MVLEGLAWNEAGKNGWINDRLKIEDHIVSKGNANFIRYKIKQR